MKTFLRLATATVCLLAFGVAQAPACTMTLNCGSATAESPHGTECKEHAGLDSGEVIVYTNAEQTSGTKTDYECVEGQLQSTTIVF